MKKFLLALCFGLIMASNALAQVRINGMVMPLTDNCYTVPATTSVESVEIELGSTLIIPNGVALEVTGPVTSPAVTCLIIEEGGQLVYVGNNTVEATVYKHIDAFEDNKWYTISTPIAEGIMASSLCDGDDNDYDLYCYLSEGPLWVESQSQEDLFMDFLGEGYLYANINDGNCKFNGTLNTSNNILVPLSYNDNISLNGFNLIGNPFPHDIYMGRHGDQNCSIYHPHILPYYYTIDGGGWWWPCEYVTPIKPCQGVLIKSIDNDLGDVSIFNNSDVPDSYPQNRIGDSNKASESKLIMTVSGNSGKDKIIVKISEGIGLDKIDHVSEVAPYFCVNYDNKKYAVAHINENSQAVDLIFRNNQAGIFTLNVEELLSDFNYLHLIDNITGDDIDLLTEPSYKFAANGNEYESRFKLVFTPNANDGIDNTTFAYISNNDIIISGVKEKATLQVYDITGRMIKSEIVSGVEGSISRVAKPNVTGVYVLRLIESNNVNTQKIVVE